MSDSAGLELLVATGNQSFTATVSEELATVGSVGEVTAVDSADPALSRVEKHSVDGVVIDDTLEDPVATADRLTSVDGTEVVLLTDGTVDTRGIETALDAGVTDVFPRTTASTQYELIVDRIENATRPAATASSRSRGTTPPAGPVARHLDRSVSSASSTRCTADSSG